jgi:ABC-2 type transport system permease protein
MILLRLYRYFRDRKAAAGAAAVGSVGGVAASPGHAALAVVRSKSDGRPSPADRGLPALIVHQARFDVRASFRNPRARFFTFAFPILLLVILVGVFGDQQTVVDGVHVKLSRFYVPGILAIAIITSAFAGLVVTIATARETGVLKRRRATPVPALVLVAGQALSVLVTALMMGTILLVIAKLAYNVGISPGGLAAVACTAVVGTLAFACIGYAVSGLIGSLDAAQPIVQATMFPLYFISGVWIPTTNLSSTLRNIADVFPVEHLAAALHQASVKSSFASAIAPKDLLVLAVWALLAAALAARRFSWLPSIETVKGGHSSHHRRQRHRRSSRRRQVHVPGRICSSRPRDQGPRSARREEHRKRRLQILRVGPEESEHE